MKTNLGISFTVAAKELKVLRRKKSIVYYIIIIPILVAVAFSVLSYYEFGTSGIGETTPLGLESLTFVFVILAAVLPTSIAAYSIVGEKVEKSLEPLLATPTTDGEILFGKSIAAFVPPMLAIWVGASIFIAVTDYVTLHGVSYFNGLAYYNFPDWTSGVMLLLLAPLAAIMSIEMTAIASSRVSDVRGANQIAGLMYVPFMAVFFAGTSGVIMFSISNLLIIALILVIAGVTLFFLSTSTFNREEILTKWK